MNPSYLMRWSVIMVLSSAACAHAGQLSIRFAGGGDEAELAFGEVVQLEVLWTMQPTDTTKSGARLSGVESRFVVTDGSGVPLTYGLTVECIYPRTGWDFSPSMGIGGPLNESSFFLSVSNLTGADIFGSGTTFSTVVATLVVRSDYTGGGDRFITIRHNNPSDPLPVAYRGAATWIFMFQQEVTGANQFDLGWGDPGDAGPAWEEHGLEAYLPLTVHSGLRGACPIPPKVGDLQGAFDGVQFYADPDADCRTQAFYGQLMTEAPPADPTPRGAAEEWLLD